MALTTNHNKLVTFGTNAFNNVIFGTFANTQEFAPGFPLPFSIQESMLKIMSASSPPTIMERAAQRPER